MRNKPVLTFILFVVAQMLLTNYFHAGAYVVLTILPVEHALKKHFDENGNPKE